MGEILKENVEDEVKESPEFITDEQEPDICDEGFDNDYNDPQLPLSISTSQTNEDTCSKSGVFCSNLLENVLEKESGLVGSVKVAKSLAWKGFSETKPEMEETISYHLERNEDGINAGL